MSIRNVSLLTILLWTCAAAQAATEAPVPGTDAVEVTDTTEVVAVEGEVVELADQPPRSAALLADRGTRTLQRLHRAAPPALW